MAVDSKNPFCIITIRSSGFYLASLQNLQNIPHGEISVSHLVLAVRRSLHNARFKDFKNLDLGRC